MPGIKYVAVYTRVSTREQAMNGYSLAEQEERLNAFCTAKDWKPVKFYSDPGMSGAKLDRPGLQMLIEDTKSHCFDAVLVWKLDRLSRSQKDTLYLIEDVFLKNNISFISMNENFDTSTAYGRAMIGILSAFAQLEREMIKERTSIGKEARAKAGQFHGGGFSAIGYDYINGQLTVNEYEAEIIQSIFKHYVNGSTLKEITRITEKYHSLHPGLSHPGRILSILKSPVYIGKIQHKGEIYQGIHEPIISEELWEEAQKIIALKSRTKTHSMSDPTALLNGLIYCNKCGARYCAHSTKSRGKEYYYYICYSRNKANARMIKDENCNNKRWPAPALDNMIIAEMRQLCFNDDYFNSIARTDNNDTAAKNRRMETVKRRLKERSAEINRLIELCKKGSAAFPIEIVAAEIEKNQAEINKLNSELKELEQECNIDYAPIKKALTMAVELFDNPESSLAEKVKVIRSLVTRINIDDDNIEVFWTFGYQKITSTPE